MNTYLDLGNGATRIFFNGVNSELYTEIDTEDVPRVRMFTWYPTCLTDRNLTRYARSLLGGKTIMLHRLIMSFPKKGQIDHADQNGLNNKKSNLRVGSATLNSLNKPTYRNKKNNMPKGVSFRRFKSCIGYRARIRVKGDLIQLGTYKTLEEAVAARKEAEEHYINLLILEESVEELLSSV